MAQEHLFKQQEISRIRVTEMIETLPEAPRGNGHIYQYTYNDYNDHKTDTPIQVLNQLKIKLKKLVTAFVSAAINNDKMIAVPITTRVDSFTFSFEG